jgi:hypothetical protein
MPLHYQCEKLWDLLVSMVDHNGNGTDRVGFIDRADSEIDEMRLKELFSARMQLFDKCIEIHRK